MLAGEQGPRARSLLPRLRPALLEGFAQEADKRSPEVRKLLGSVPGPTAGLFTHDLEQKYGEAAIPDAVFERRFAFFDKYTGTWMTAPGT